MAEITVEDLKAMREVIDAKIAARERDDALLNLELARQNAGSLRAQLDKANATIAEIRRAVGCYAGYAIRNFDDAQNVVAWQSKMIREVQALTTPKES